MQVGQVPIELLKVKAVPDEELVWDREAHVADWKVFDQPPVWTVEQRYRCERRGIAERQRLAEVIERQPGVDDVFDDDHVAAGDLRVEVLEQPDASMTAGVCTRGVARQLDEVDLVRDVERTREIRQEDEARLQRGDEEGLAAVVVGRDLTAELSDPRLQLLTREVDLSEPRARPYDASSSRYRSARRSMSRL